MTVADGVGAQANVENLQNRVYFPTAYNTITSGAPRTIRQSLTTGF